MSKQGKIILAVSLIVITIVAGILLWMYYPAIQTAINGERYYTSEDIDDAYNAGVGDKDEMLSQIDSLKIDIDKYLKDISDYQTRVADLTKDLNDALENGGLKDDEIEDLEQQIKDMEIEIDGLEDTVLELQLLLEAYENIDKLRVTFVLFDNNDETPYKIQLVDENGYLSEVETPEGSDFEGWSLTKGGELIDDLTTIQVIENMTVYGMFTNTVTFMANGEEYSTQEVSYNKYASDVEVSLTGYTFNGWSLTENGETIALSTTPIITDTTFYALLNGKGFTTWEEKTWYGDYDASYLTAENIWTDGENVYCTTPMWETYILNKETSTWQEKTWNVMIQGNYTWSDGEDIYYSFGEGKQYILNKETSTWQEKVWYGYQPASSKHIWTDGESIYYSNDINRQYILNKETSTWEAITWNGVANIQGEDTWTDGENTYYFDGHDNFILHKETKTWIEVTLTVNCLDGSNKKVVIYAEDVWTDGTNIYYSSYSEQYVWNKETSTWAEKTWTGLNRFNGSLIWTDGVNYYYANSSEQYVLV